MMVHIQLENLEKEYQKKLRERMLTRETIYNLAYSVSKKYHQQKRVLLRLAVIAVFMTLGMALTGIWNSDVSGGNQKVFLISCAVALALELLIFIGVYWIAVTRVPRQFALCLNEGYPELTTILGYEAIRKGDLEELYYLQRYSFSLYIEDVFDLKDSRDIVVTGFAHGLINRSRSVYLVRGKGSLKKEKAAIVSGIEIDSGKSVAQAADCYVALRILNGKEIDPKAGMYLVAEHF